MRTRPGLFVAGVALLTAAACPHAPNSAFGPAPGARGTPSDAARAADALARVEAAAQTAGLADVGARALPPEARRSGTLRVQLRASGSAQEALRALETIGGPLSGGDAALPPPVAQLERLRLAVIAPPRVQLEATLALQYPSDERATLDGGRRAAALTREPTAILSALAGRMPRLSVALTEVDLGDTLRLRGFKLRPGSAAFVKTALDWAGYSVSGFIANHTGACDLFEIVARGATATAHPADADRLAELFERDDRACRADDVDGPASTIRLAAGPGDLALRLRNVGSAELFGILSGATGQSFVVDGDVRQRLSVEAGATSLEPLLQTLARETGLAISPPGALRRVGRVGSGASRLPEPLAGEGRAITLRLRHAAVADVLARLAEAAGVEIQAGAGDLGEVSVFVDARPWTEVLPVVLDAAHLRLAPTDGPTGALKLSVERDRHRDLAASDERPRHPAERGWALRAEALRSLAAAVTDTHAETRAEADAQTGPEMNALGDFELAGLVRASGEWRAYFFSGHRFELGRAGWRLADGRIESIDATGVSLRSDDGHSLRVELPPAEP